MTEKQVKSILRIVSAGLSALTILLLPAVPLSQPVPQLVMPAILIPIEEIILRPIPPKPRPRPPALGPLTAQMMPAPYIAPSDVSAPPTQIILAEPAMEEPQIGLLSPIFDRPPEEPSPVRMSPVASPLPDIITQRSDDGPAKPPPAALPGPELQRGELYRGTGSPTLEVRTEPSYTGPDLNLPQTELPEAGLTRGAAVPTTPQPGPGPGDRYQSRAGTSPGADLSESLQSQGDVVGEGELSGLLNWLRQQHIEFPPVVRSYLETSSGDLLGVTRYAGWDIYVQFAEDEHQLKIFLARGGTGILLADSDFKRRSQLFGLGHVTRDAAGTIVAIEAQREKPSHERTDDFYRVFGSWMEAQGIKMGSRTSK
ncbi:hypothetical protein KKH27_02405 [bacterium]|nr:hypothetical protein [bacterium]MBU1984665.1 hypothetical protein [bacterium]